MHVHDEIVIEAEGIPSLDEICKKMCETPAWAKGLILNAEGFVTTFYKKN